MFGYDRDGDDDTLSDAEEVLAGTDPFVADSDGDGVLDGVEVRRGMDPFAADSDGDGIPDAEDVWPTTPSVADPFVPTDTPVSQAGSSLPDPEFDNASGRFVWQDSDGLAVWVGDLDPATGALVPADGRGTLIDTDVTPIGWGRNGPEWMVSAAGSEVVYAKVVGNQPRVMVATEGPGGWSVNGVPGTRGARSPFGSLDPNDTRPRVMYSTDIGGVAGSWWFDPMQATGGLALPRFYQFPRWVVGRRAVTGAARVGPVDQVFVVDVDTLVEEQVTFDPTDKGSVFFFLAPEMGGERMMFTTQGDVPNLPERLVVYRLQGGSWTPVKEIAGPPGFPFIISPEPLTWDGRSYVSFLASKGSVNLDNGEAQVWLAALSPADPLIRLISAPNAVVRKDPESYTAGARPWVYYSRILANGQRVIRRCELGL